MQNERTLPASNIQELPENQVTYFIFSPCFFFFGGGGGGGGLIKFNILMELKNPFCSET